MVCYRTDAACAAALAAAGQGEDADKLDDKERTRLRKQALDWLRADLALRTKQLETGKPADRTTEQQGLRQMQEESDLASFRDGAALAKLPADEQKAFTQLWADVSALQTKGKTLTAEAAKTSTPSADKPDQALSFLEQTLKQQQARLGSDHPDTLNSMNNLASAYLDALKFDMALSLYKEMLKLCKDKVGPDHPSTLASMVNLARAYRDAGRLDLALSLYEKTFKLLKAKLGTDHPDTLDAKNGLGVTYWKLRQLDKSVPLFEALLKYYQAKFGWDDSKTLQAAGNLGVNYRDAGRLKEAIPLLEKTLELRKTTFSPDHPDTLSIKNDLAYAYVNAGKLDLAVPLYEETLKLRKAKLGPDHPHTLVSMNNLATGYEKAGKIDLAVSLLEETLKLSQAKFGPNHPNILVWMRNLAFAYASATQFEKSAALFEEILKRQEAKLGRDHPQTLESVADMGVFYKDRGRNKEAIPLLEEAQSAVKKHPGLGRVTIPLLVACAKADENTKCTNLLKEIVDQHGPEHPMTLSATESLGVAYWEMRQLDKSIPLFEALLKRRVAKQGPDHQETLLTKVNLGINYRDAGRLAEAIPLLEEAQRAAEKYGAADFAGILATCIIADMAANRGDYQRAEEILTERLTSLRQSKDDQRFAILQIELGLANIAQARGDNEAAAIKHGALLERAQKELGDGHWLTLTAMNNRGFALARGRKFAEAEKTLQETIERQVRFLGEGHMNLLQTRTNLGELYQLRGDHARAEELLRKCLAEREKKEPNSFREASTQSMLGRVLAEQKKFAEAEALLLAGYKGLKDNPNTTPGWGKYYLPDTLEWLVQLYEMTDKEDEAAKRQAERAKYPPAAPAANEKK